MYKRLIYTVVSMLFLVIPMSAQKVSIEVKDATVKQAIANFEKNNDFKIVYDGSGLDLDRKVTIDAFRRPIAEVLAAIIGDQDITYEVQGQFVILKGDGMTRKAGVQITGRVAEKDGGEPIAGAMVSQKGTMNATTTDIDGQFTLYVPEGSYLTINLLGYIPQNVKAKPGMTVLMKQSNYELDEVVVIGYGSAQKSDLTGSMTMVDGDRLNTATTGNTSTLLQGQLAGVEVTNGSGDPNSHASIRVRGVTSMSETSPLIIVDGMPVESLDDAVSPQDIANIQVLKDAASAAIYGSRAAAGVILVTTKRPADNTFRVDYNYEFSLDVPTMRPRSSNVVDYMMAKNEMAYNDAFGAVPLYSAYSKDYVENYMYNHSIDPDQYPATDWINSMIKRRTSHQRHELVISGGVKNLKTRVSFNYFTQNYLDGDKDYDRYSFRMNNNLNIARWLTAAADVTFVAVHNDENQLDAFGRALAFAPIYADKWSDGVYAYGKDGDNPLAVRDLSGHMKNYSYNLFGRFQLTLNPIEQLSFTLAAAPDFTFYKGRNYNQKFKIRNPEGVMEWSRFNSSTSLTERRRDSKSVSLQAYANYADTYDVHKYNLMVGYEEYQVENSTIAAWRNNYDINGFPYLDMGPENYQYNSGSASHRAYRSTFGRAMYSYDNRYLVQFNLRADGSSRFARGHRWGWFPSASAGWVVSQEPWFKCELINNLKLRASWGRLGNERLNGADFPYAPLISFINVYQPTTSGGVNSIKSSAQLAYAFRNLTWEKTTTYDVGFDLSMLNSRLRTSFDYYYKKTTDMLITVNFPKYFGYNSPMGNQAEMNTRGWDFEISWRERLDEITYNVTFNLSDYRSRMGYMADRRDIGTFNITEKGSYYNEWYGYKNQGVILNEAAMTDANGKRIPTASPSDAPGAIRYRDINGDGAITPTADRVRLGNSLPELQYGGAVWIYWRDFDFNLTFQGVGRQMKRIDMNKIQPLRETWQSVPQELVGNHWSPFNTDAQNARMKYPYITYNNAGSIYAMSDFWLVNGGYFRVKNITAGYTIPNKITQRYKIKSLRVYFSANNLPAISGYINGWDPEFESGRYILSSYTFGLKIGL